MMKTVHLTSLGIMLCLNGAHSASEKTDVKKHPFAQVAAWTFEPTLIKKQKCEYRFAGACPLGTDQALEKIKEAPGIEELQEKLNEMSDFGKQFQKQTKEQRQKQIIARERQKQEKRRKMVSNIVRDTIEKAVKKSHAEEDRQKAVKSMVEGIIGKTISAAANHKLVNKFVMLAKELQTSTKRMTAYFKWMDSILNGFVNKTFAKKGMFSKNDPVRLFGLFGEKAKFNGATGVMIAVKPLGHFLIANICRNGKLLSNEEMIPETKVNPEFTRDGFTGPSIQKYLKQTSELLDLMKEFKKCSHKECLGLLQNMSEAYRNVRNNAFVPKRSFPDLYTEMIRKTDKQICELKERIEERIRDIPFKMNEKLEVNYNSEGKWYEATYKGVHTKNGRKDWVDVEYLDTPGRVLGVRRNLVRRKNQ